MFQENNKHIDIYNTEGVGYSLSLNITIVWNPTPVFITLNVRRGLYSYMTLSSRGPTSDVRIRRLYTSDSDV